MPLIVSATTQAYTLQTHAATIIAGLVVAASTQTYTLQTYAATIGALVTVNAGVQAFALQTYSASVSNGMASSGPTWDEIRWSSENGLDCYDFGGAGWAGEEYGPRHFKKKFGGELVRFGRYRRVHSRFKLRLAESAYNLMRGSISRWAK